MITPKTFYVVQYGRGQDFSYNRAEQVAKEFADEHPDTPVFILEAVAMVETKKVPQNIVQLERR